MTSHSDQTLVGYTGVFNVLDYSCVSFPTGILGEKEVDVPLDDHKPLSALCKDTHADCKLAAPAMRPISILTVSQMMRISSMTYP